MTYLACVIGFDIETDILPFAIAALADFPEVEGITALEICALAEKYYNRRPPRNVFPPIPDDTIIFLIRRITARVFTTHRIAQIDDPDVRKMRPYVDFTFEDVLCEEAAKLTGRFHPKGTLLVLPLAGCKFRNCHCRYRTRSRRDLESLGQIGEDGEAHPLPASQPTQPS